MLGRSGLLLERPYSRGCASGGHFGVGKGRERRFPIGDFRYPPAALRSATSDRAGSMAGCGRLIRRPPGFLLQHRQKVADELGKGLDVLSANSGGE